MHEKTSRNSRKDDHGITSPDWQPREDLEDFNRLIVKLEQEYLAVLRGSRSLSSLLDEDLIDALCDQIDQDPQQAVLMTRIKSGHAMTPRHGINVMILARAWALSAHKLGHNIADFTRAALFHDLGHWRPDNLIYVFGPFTHEEYRQMQSHTIPPDEELEPLGEKARLWIAQHHEQPDGKGYPEGITDPHPLSQLLRIADCFEGLTTPRRFRLTYSFPKALRLMQRWSGFKYDAGLFESFFRFMQPYPAGSFITLRNSAIAVTLPKGKAMVLSNQDGDPLAEPVVRALEPDEIRDEAPTWGELQLPDHWRGLRPDLMGLPRFYPSVA